VRQHRHINRPEWQRAYIAGFFDGDGSVNQGKRGKWKVSFYQKDPHILTKIQEWVGCGKIYTTHSGVHHRLCFSSRADVTRITDIIYPYVLTPTKRQRLERFYASL
jgi:LAGLIDADG-like domain